MKTSIRVILHFVFVSVLLFTGCGDLSPSPVPVITGNPTPDSTQERSPEITSVPVNTPETSPSCDPSAVPAGTPDSAETGTPVSGTSATPSPAITEEATPVWSPDPSPDEFTPVPLPTKQTKGILITEIMYNPGSPDSDWEWIEVFNSTGEEINLSGWVIDDNNGTFLASSNIASGKIPPGGTCILFNIDMVTLDDFKTAWEPEINMAGVTGWGAMGLNNTGDKIGIWDKFSSYKGDHILHRNAVYTLEYSDKAPWPVDNGSGSIYLKDLTADSTDGKNWVLSKKGAITPAGTCYQSTEWGTNTGSDIGSP